MTDLAIKSFRVKNFKAILDSGTVEFSPLTVLIGNNGSGKSSFIEGLETYQIIIKQGSMNRWRGFEHVRNRINPHEMEFELRLKPIKTTTFRSTMSVTIGKESELLIVKNSFLAKKSWSGTHKELLIFQNFNRFN